MSEIRTMTTILRRMFSRRAASRPLAGIRNKMQVMKQDEPVDHFDAEDVSEFEADFMNVGVSHKMHEREMQSKKEHLKRRIVAHKYFKEREPRFITFAERKMICKLHNHNPDEWTAEKLSESFPALPETIRMILRAKWSPKSVDKVMQYDNVAIANWEKFRAGNLVLSPALGEHLTKFKDRKIIRTDRDSLAEQFVCKREFEKPRSQLFSSIIQTYLDGKESDAKLLPQEDNSGKLAGQSKNQNLLIASATTDSPAAVKEKFFLNKKQLRTNSEQKKLDVQFDKKEEKRLTFDEFVKAKLKDINQESPEEGVTLMNVYRKQVEASQSTQAAQVATAFDSAAPNAKEDTSLKIVRQADKDVSIFPKDRNRDFQIIGADDNLLDTSIKVWNKKVDVDLNYAKPIKIAKHLHQPGMTYRISDCYYDDDGEFLYRVPGVYS
ncbi:PREDICTED: uncharacterized protein LOC105568437 [Vollenhovia emeryi]|uniref:uncharacterized protein LOC105568437 n=1 Tax=Vollenhovia emeryi TaxID=411798 RepID=UPI0005F48AE1|nr:PREDICTED: uncharacterized protein LOC105568437 [Vollenhovia emeryi]